MRKLITAEAVVTGLGTVGDSVLIDDGRVVAVGNRGDLTSTAIFEERYPGAFIIPGLRDAHLHAVPYASVLWGYSLKAATDIADLQDRLASQAGSRGEGLPLVATRLDDESLAEGRLPTRGDLDAAVSDRPVVVYRYCGHVAVANSAALSASGIDMSTRDPEGGTIDRDSAGIPTGVLRETAMGLVAPALEHDVGVSDDQLVEALRGLAGLGVTSIGAMIGYGERPFEQLEAEVDLWCRVARRLPIKVHAFVIAETPTQLERAAEALTAAGPRLRWLGVKRFADGSLGGHTAAMNAPFHDVATTGTYRLTEADAVVARASLAIGGMVAVHAIGDRAVNGVLDMFEELIRGGADPADLRMEHVSVIAPSQIRRISDLGVTACVQPAFLASESTWLADRLGPDRREWVYPFRSLLHADVPVAGSSDCPVEPPHPLWGIAAAMDRYGVNPHERLSGLEALAMFTSGAARALREPEPLSSGAPADLVIVDVDPSTATPQQVRSARILDTYIDGRSVDVDRSLEVWPD